MLKEKKAVSRGIGHRWDMKLHFDIGTWFCYYTLVPGGPNVTSFEN
ncbi:MAG: hypothetical protein PHR77_11000 [Kiritimatiellae bacterium]|nr:hypothetical protein [Kiritimatiellia bacterium]MDD5520809.1 hypothetical protein [Kiritimatiellia bacterium]